MEELFINVLAQELIIAKEIADEAQAGIFKPSPPMTTRVLLSIKDATKDDYQRIGDSATVSFLVLPDGSGMLIFFAGMDCIDSRVPNMAAFNYLINESDAYEWSFNTNHYHA